VSVRGDALPALHVVTGKGGVGKSTFAAALATAAARDGRRVLAVELGAPAGVSRLLQTRPTAHGVPAPVEPKLRLAYYDGEQALAEFLRRRVPFGGLLEAALAHPLYRAFVSTGPGVRELMAIGKVRDELLALGGGPRRWDALVLDAGASGHALQILRMPAATARTFSRGLAHREATKVARFLEDPARTRVHVVALPERMPLEEAEETVTALRAMRLPLGRLVVNRCREPAPAGVDAAVAEMSQAARDPAEQSLAATVSGALGWTRIQERGIAAVERELGLTALRLPRLIRARFGRREVGELAEHLEGALT
jgi:anion-transporting  ArsA/GET3 family ATPase